MFSWLQNLKPSPPKPATVADVRDLILRGRAPDGLTVRGHLNLAHQPALRSLPANLSATSIDLSGCTGLAALPDGLRASRLVLDGCTALRALPAGLRCFELSLHNTRLRALPADLQVANRLDLSGCAELEALPANLTVGTLILRECTALGTLPEGLDVHFLDLEGCTRLAAWPRAASVQIGRLNARGCVRLATLPPWLENVAQLDVGGCANLDMLPATLRVSSWIDLAGTALQSLPPQLADVALRWRGVPIDARIAFRPETITAAEVLAETNAELRRVLLERMGYDAFLAAVDAAVLDEDEDPGGERRLLKVLMPGDEDLVCVAVYCPSTGRQYLLRVPPTMRSCRQAVAWIAGFDSADDYRPLLET